MAAEEEEAESVVVVDSFSVNFERGRGLLAATTRALAAPFVDEAPVRHRREPRSRVGRPALLGPLAGSRHKRLLYSVLAGVELAVPAHEPAKDLRRQLAQQVLDDSVAA